MVEHVWNYSFSVPCALLMITFLVFYFSRPHLPIRMNRTFLGLLAIQMLVMVLDVSASLADEHHDQFAPESLYALNTLFFACFALRVFWFFLITVEITHVKRSKAFALTALPFIAYEVLCLTSFATGAVFSIEGGIYRSGPAYNAIYACSLFYIGASLAIVALRSKSLRRRDFVSTLAFNLVLLVGNFVRYLFPNLLVMNTFCMVAIAILYLASINPDLYLTDTVSVFNARGFQKALADRSSGKGYNVLGFALMNYNYKRSMVGGNLADRAIRLMVGYIDDAFPDAVVFYLGDGRFALILADGKRAEDAYEKIRERFQQPWDIGSMLLSFNVAFASATTEADARSADEVVNLVHASLDEARDAAQYESGEMGEGMTNVLMVDGQVKTLRLVERALENDEVEVFLQPVFDSATKSIVGAEALARIRDDEGNIVPPDSFIPVAEKAGLISQLDEQVFEKACKFIEEHDLDAAGLRWINVNVSPLQCLRQDTPERLAGILESHNVPASRIHLEITEQSMIDYELLQKQILALRDRGFLIALDDYGTGYSNLMRVLRNPFANIKLDTELVWSYVRERDQLLPAVVHAFTSMGFSVTAEGIETSEMAEALTAVGCSYLQGYLFDRPLPMNEFAKRYAGDASRETPLPKTV